jgi:CheY-like chemotaxis protein
MSTILVIDDDAASRSLIERKFVPLGHEVVAAPDGVQGVDIVRARPVDLILLDLRMPVQDGLETLRLIWDVRPGANVIIVTAYFDDAAFAAALPGALERGVKAILHKPVSIRELSSVVQRVLGITLPQTRPLPPAG